MKSLKMTLRASDANIRSMVGRTTPKVAFSEEIDSIERTA